MSLFCLTIATGVTFSTPLMLLAIALFFATMLTIAYSRLKVEEDPKVVAVRDNLPGANCGGCGFASCDQFAEKVAALEMAPEGCVVLSAEANKAIASLLGIDAGAAVRKRAVVHCGAQMHEQLNSPDYHGPKTCGEANLIAGILGCTYGCLGLGDCQRVCGFDAIEMNEGLPVISIDDCTGCAACVSACPRNIISIEKMIDDPLVFIACRSQDAGKTVRGNCKVGCIGCGLCAKLKPEVFSLTGTLCEVNYDPESYTGTADLEGVVAKCPTVCLRKMGDEIADPHYMVTEREQEKAAKAAAKKMAADAAAKEAATAKSDG
jgi:H+/Na+-translocating ferredoxin:NAD+ oxidoreductase subunit B